VTFRPAMVGTLTTVASCHLLSLSSTIQASCQHKRLVEEGEEED